MISGFMNSSITKYISYLSSNILHNSLLFFYKAIWAYVRASQIILWLLTALHFIYLSVMHFEDIHQLKFTSSTFVTQHLYNLLRVSTSFFSYSLFLISFSYSHCFHLSSVEKDELSIISIVILKTKCSLKLILFGINQCFTC